MTSRFEENVRQVFASFMAETERNVTAAIRKAFAEITMHAVDDAAAPTLLRPPPRSTERALQREQLIRCVHDNPGSTTAELSGWLGIHDGKVRRLLRRLGAEGVIRWEERRSGFGGQSSRTFFLQQSEAARFTNVVEQTHGAHSAAPSAAMRESS
jgi:hypothetical protein